MTKYLLATLGGAVVGAFITGWLATEKFADLERELTHSEYERMRLKNLLGLHNSGVVE